MSFSVKKTGGRMWHEARKQEKKIRGMLVDYRRRAERRRDYYEKIKSDPTQFLQLHGRPCKIHLDPAVAAAGDSPANMMPWQGNEENLIDRFDVRAHLDWIPEPPNTIDVDIALTSEDRHINYERYRIIVQNEFLGVTEEKFLHQIHIEEQFGSATKPDSAKDKKKSAANAAIGYNYETEEPITDSNKSADSNSAEDKAEDEDSDIDLDICVDVSQIEPSQAHEMNQVAQKYGLLGADYFSFLTQDVEEAETLRQARKQEEEKAMYSGRRSRRERRAFREKKMIGRVMSPPSYAARESPEYNPYRKSSSKSRSRSASPINAGQITYITSFGGEEEAQGSSTQIATISTKKPNYSHLRRKRSESPVFIDRTTARKVSKSRSRSRSRSLTRSRPPYKSRERRRSPIRSRLRRTRSRSRRRSGSRSRSRSKRTRSRSRSQRSRSRSDSKTSRSRSRSRVRSKSRSRSRQRRSRSRSSTSSSSSEYKSRSRSRSRNRSRSKDSYRRRRYSGSRSRSRSNTRRSRSNEIKTSTLPRYYGRRGKSSSLELELSDSGEKNMPQAPKPPIISTSTNKPKAGLSTYSGGGYKSSKITPQERLKRKMQALLNRQYKADKKAEQLRIEKMEQQRQDREDEIREMSLKLRRRQRELRHKYDGHSSDSNSSNSRSPTPTRSPRPQVVRRDRRDRDVRDVDLGNDRDKDREREREREREKEREKERQRDREREREKERERERERERQRDRERERERERERDRDRERERDRGRDRDRRDDRNKDRYDTRRRHRESPRQSPSPRSNRGLVDY